ncbi:hypothetical protein E2C01_032003 [Portunus trituberculatus]|uniref:Uncharacterized protein n=1 Tax=Portunus trituberculatus TaxID=210409 RepID=A0A5B7EZE4_PORTR|nr:hypothetical protein [Portunus trituberculatus]
MRAYSQHTQDGLQGGDCSSLYGRAGHAFPGALCPNWSNVYSSARVGREMRVVERGEGAGFAGLASPPHWVLVSTVHGRRAGGVVGVGQACWVEPWKDVSLYGKKLTGVFVIMNVDLGA